MVDLIIFNAFGTLGIHTLAAFMECVKIYLRVIFYNLPRKL